MKKTIQEMFTEFRRECEKYARLNELDIAIYISGTKNKKTKFEKLINKFWEDSKLDFDLKIINKEKFKKDYYTYNIMKTSLNHYQLY